MSIHDLTRAEIEEAVDQLKKGVEVLKEKEWLTGSLVHSEPVSGGNWEAEAVCAVGAIGIGAGLYSQKKAHFRSSPYSCVGAKLVTLYRNKGHVEFRDGRNAWRFNDSTARKKDDVIKLLQDTIEFGQCLLDSGVEKVEVDAKYKVQIQCSSQD